MAYERMRSSGVRASTGRARSHQVCLLDANGQMIAANVTLSHGGAGHRRSCATGLLPAHGSGARADRGGDRDAAWPGGRSPAGTRLPSLRHQSQAARSFRDRFTVAGAKDDSRDAHVLGDSLRTDRHAFRRLSVDDPVIIELREWSRMAEDLQQERNSSGQPGARAALALLPADARAGRRPRGRLVPAICGNRHRHRRRRPSCARRPSSGPSKRTASAAWMPRGVADPAREAVHGRTGRHRGGNRSYPHLAARIQAR